MICLDYPAAFGLALAGLIAWLGVRIELRKHEEAARRPGRSDVERQIEYARVIKRDPPPGPRPTLRPDNPRKDTADV